MKNKYIFAGILLTFILYLVLCLVYIPRQLDKSICNDCYCEYISDAINNSEVCNSIFRDKYKDIKVHSRVEYGYSILQKILMIVSSPFSMMYCDSNLHSTHILIHANFLSYYKFEDCIENCIKKICIDSDSKKNNFNCFYDFCDNVDYEVIIEIDYILNRNDLLSKFGISNYRITKKQIVKIK